MSRWQPNAGQSVGLPYWPVTIKSFSLGSTADAIAADCESSSVEDIARVAVNVLSATAPGLILCEVFRAGQEIPGTMVTTVLRPAGDLAVGSWENEAASAVDLWQSIDEATLDLTDYITATAFDAVAYEYQLDVPAGTFAGRRIIAVRLKIVGLGPSAVTLTYRQGGTIVDIGLAALYGLGATDAALQIGELNPITQELWTPADVEDFDTAGGSAVGIRVATHGTFPRIYTAFVEIDHVPENRVALDVHKISAGHLGWRFFDLHEPDGTDNWPKGIHDYSLVFRRVDSSASIAFGMPGLGVGATSAPPVGPGSTPIVQLDGRITALGSTVLGAPAVVLMRTDGEASDDSQPYATRQSFSPVGLGIRQDLAEVDTAEYVIVQAVVKVLPTATGTLDVSVCRTSDDTVMGSGSVDAADALEQIYLADGESLLLTIPLSPTANLVAGTAYYLKFSRATLDLDFQVWGLSSVGAAVDDQPGTVGRGTYLDETGELTVGLTPYPAVDLMAIVAQASDPPDDPIATVVQLDLTMTGNPCDVPWMEYARVQWNATALGTVFARYEVQRSYDGVAWDLLAQITDEAVTEMRDYTGARGRSTSYRLRVVHTDGIPSAWSGESVVVCEPFDCERIYASNERPDLICAYEVDATTEFEHLDADETVFMKLYGVDGMAAFQPLERRFDRFADNVKVNGGGEPAVAGRDAFQPLIDLSLAGVAQVAVLEAEGHVWLAALQVPKSTRTEPGWLYRQTVIVTELTRTVAPIDVRSC